MKKFIKKFELTFWFRLINLVLACSILAILLIAFLYKGKSHNFRVTSSESQIKKTYYVDSLIWSNDSVFYKNSDGGLVLISEDYCKTCKIDTLK